MPVIFRRGTIIVKGSMVEGIVCGNEKTSGKELRTNSPLCVSACSLGNPSDHAFALNQTVSPFSSAIWYNSRYKLMRLKLMLLSWTQGARIVVRARLESSSSIVGKSTTCTVPLCKCGHRSTGVHSVRSSFFVNPSFNSRSHPRLRKSLSDCDAGVVCRCGIMPSVDFLSARDQLVATSVLFGSITRIFCFRSKLKCKTNPRQRGLAFATEGLCFTVVVAEQ